VSVQIYQLPHRDDDGNPADDYDDVDARAGQHARARRAAGASAAGPVALQEHLVTAFAQKSEAAYRQWHASGEPADLRQALNWRTAMDTAMQDEDAA